MFGTLIVTQKVKFLLGYYLIDHICDSKKGSNSRF